MLSEAFLRCRYRTNPASVCIDAQMKMVWHNILHVLETSFIGYQNRATACVIATTKDVVTLS